MSKIIYKNFSVLNGGCISQATMPLENQGLVLIQGVNKDEGGSNGSGKSTLFDLLANTCTGRTGKMSGSKYLKKNDLLNIKNPKNFHTQLVFQKGSSEYIINNYRAHDEHKTGIEIIVDGIDETPTIGIDKVQAKVSTILGLTPDEFYGQIYLSQQYTHALVHGTPSEKSKYLSLYFGLDSINLLTTLTKKRVESIVIPNERELIDLKDSVQQQLDSISDEASMLSKLQIIDKDRKESQARVLELRFIIENQNKAKIVEEQSKEWESKLAKMNLTFTVPELKKQEAIVAGIVEIYTTDLRRMIELEKVELELSNLGVAADTSYQEVRKEIEIQEAAIQAKSEELVKLERRKVLENEFNSLPKSDKDWKTLSLELSQKEKEIKVYQKNLNTLKVEIDKLSFKGKECPTCLRPIAEEEHQNLLSSREHKHTNLQPIVDELLKDIEDVKLLTNAKEKQLLIEADLTDLPEGDPNRTKLEIQSTKTTKQKLQLLADSLVRSSSLQDRALRLRQEDANLGKTQEELRDSLNNLNNKLTVIKTAKEWLLSNGQVKFDMVALGLATEEIQLREEQLSNLIEESLRLNKSLTIRNQLNKQLADVNAILSRNSIEKNRKRILEVINVTVADIRKQKLKQATEALSSILPYYIKQLFPQGDVRVSTPDNGSDFDLFLDKGNQQISLYAASGGQAKRVVLAIFFAFSQIGSKGSNILLGDEIFKDLDPRGREATYDIIRDLKIPSIFITSHDNDLDQKNRYDQVWRVVMENDTSVLEID
jgi:energy-coupling factor transporter ATP-binding protein EcfA2